VTHPPPNASLGHVSVLLNKLAELLDNLVDPSAEQLAALICQLATLETSLAARLIGALSTLHERSLVKGDRLLTVGEAAERLATSKDWVYRQHHRLPFAVRHGRQIRFSMEGLDRYIRDRVGAERSSHPR
jgi:excisionase family DNA binding protein